MTSIAAAAHELQRYQDPIIRGWGDILLSFNDLSATVLDSPFSDKESKISFVATNFNLPSAVFDALTFFTKSKAFTECLAKYE